MHLYHGYSLYNLSRRAKGQFKYRNKESVTWMNYVKSTRKFLWVGTHPFYKLALKQFHPADVILSHYISATWSWKLPHPPSSPSPMIPFAPWWRLAQLSPPPWYRANSSMQIVNRASHFPPVNDGVGICKGVSHYHSPFFIFQLHIKNAFRTKNNSRPTITVDCTVMLHIYIIHGGLVHTSLWKIWRCAIWAQSH